MIPESGGTFSYEKTLLKGIHNYAFHPDIEIINIILYDKDTSHINSKKEGLRVKSNYIVQIRNLLNKNLIALKPYLKNPVSSYIYRFFQARRSKKIETLLKKEKIDLVYYLRPEENILDYPFIATHWDIAHRSMHPYPEIFMNGVNENRENYYLKTLNKAFLILCESIAGAKELQKYYLFFQGKIKILPIFSGDIINLNVLPVEQVKHLSVYNLKKQKYFIYPAQFWAHKNHYNLIFAFRELLLETKDLDLKLVLCGSDKGNMDYIKQLVHSLSLNKSVIFTGFVSNKSLYSFYKNAIALVMPTFLGPTNMPLIESAYLKCAVLCSDFEGHKEILGENAIYFSPSDKNSIKISMLQVLSEEFRMNLIDSAYQHINQSNFNIDKSLDILNKILLDIIPFRKTWGTSYQIK